MNELQVNRELRRLNAKLDLMRYESGHANGYERYMSVADYAFAVNSGLEGRYDLSDVERECARYSKTIGIDVHYRSADSGCEALYHFDVLKELFSV